MNSNEVNLTIPLHVTVRVGDMNQVSIAAGGMSAGTEEAARPRSYYQGYGGYEEDFLGIAVPLVTLTDEQRRNAAKDNLAPEGADPTVLRYTNFSIVMNRRRQLAYYTAVNIDGSQSTDMNRGRDRWYYDSRIAESEQIGEELYRRNNLDRGHLVRRLDPVWGRNAARANDDTFHFTNCSPQHARFNQGQEMWQGLENYILYRADARDQKVTVFTGPVMDDRDPIYRGVRLPLAYWKIIAYVKNDNLSAAAYILDQGALIQEELGFEAAFDAGAFRVKLEHLKQRTNLNFDYLQENELPISLDGLEAGRDRLAVQPDFGNVVL